MDLSTGIQENLVAILCYDDSPGGGKFVAGILQPEDYDPYYRDIVSRAIKYARKYDKVPGEHTIDIIEQLQRNFPDNASIYGQIYEVLNALRDGANKEYVLSQATTFCRYQGMKKGIVEALDALDEDNVEGVDRAQSILSNSTEQSFAMFDKGTALTETTRSLRFLDEASIPFLSGISQLDNIRLGPCRKRLHLMVAPSGRGKSWWLVHVAKHCLMQRLKVLYVTLELSEEEVCGRVFQALFSIRKRDQKIVRQLFTKDELGRFTGLREVSVANRPHLEQGNIYRYLVTKIGDVLEGAREPLIVKEFPTKGLTIRELDSFIDSLEGARGFIPDVLIVDYPDLMKTDGEINRFSIGALYGGIRGIAVKRNLAGVVVTQTNKGGAKQRNVRETDSAESYEKIATSDVVLTYSQTEAEHGLGLCRVFVDKGRTDVAKIEILVSQAYGIGQFCMDSVIKTRQYDRFIDQAERGSSEGQDDGGEDLDDLV